MSSQTDVSRLLSVSPQTPISGARERSSGAEDPGFRKLLEGPRPAPEKPERVRQEPARNQAAEGQGGGKLSPLESRATAKVGLKDRPGSDAGNQTSSSTDGNLTLRESTAEYSSEADWLS